MAICCWLDGLLWTERSLRTAVVPHTSMFLYQYAPLFSGVLLVFYTRLLVFSPWRSSSVTHSVDIDE